MTGLREGLAEALSASWLLQLYPARLGVTLAVADGALVIFLRDTSSGGRRVPPAASAEPSPIRKAAIDAVRRRVSQPFSLWGLS